jgi:hypothetical protein
LPSAFALALARAVAVADAVAEAVALAVTAGWPTLAEAVAETVAFAVAVADTVTFSVAVRLYRLDAAVLGAANASSSTASAAMHIVTRRRVRLEFNPPMFTSLSPFSATWSQVVRYFVTGRCGNWYASEPFAGLRHYPEIGQRRHWRDDFGQCRSDSTAAGEC